MLFLFEVYVCGMCFYCLDGNANSACGDRRLFCASLTQEAVKIMRHSRRATLLPMDIKLALTSLNASVSGALEATCIVFGVVDVCQCQWSQHKTHDLCSPAFRYFLRTCAPVKTC